MEAAMLNLITIGDVCKQLHSLFNNTGVSILVALTASTDNGLHKIVETIDRNVLKEATNFCAYESQLQLK